MKALLLAEKVAAMKVKGLTDDQVKSELARNNDSAVVTYLGAL
jgi:hypothetical protein